MNVWDHIAELRSRLLKCIYLFLLGLVPGFFVMDPFIAWLSHPVGGELVFVHPTEAFSVQIKIAAGFAVLICLPFWLYQLWSFAASGLHEKEKRYILWAVPFSYAFFMIGMTFSSLWVFPRAVEFLMTFKTTHLHPMLSVESYLDFFMFLGLAFGVLFQLPLVLHFLAKMGILRPETLAPHRKIAYLTIFLLATFFNPVPEVLTQLVLAGAAIGLFELSILLVRWELRKR